MGQETQPRDRLEAFQALRESVSGAELVTALELGSVPFVDLVSLRGAAERDASLVPAYQLALQAFQEIHGPQVGFWSYDEGDIAITEKRRSWFARVVGARPNTALHFCVGMDQLQPKLGELIAEAETLTARAEDLLGQPSGVV